MLTKDENIVLVDFNVQYHGAPIRSSFAFGVRDPDETLKQAAESAVRAVIGGSDMDTILSGQRTEARWRKAKQMLQATLDQYKTGLAVTELNFQNVRPPQEVKEAFDDANSAREDKQRLEQRGRGLRQQRGAGSARRSRAARAEAAGYKAERVASGRGRRAALQPDRGAVQGRARSHAQAPVPGNDAGGARRTRRR